MARTRRYALVCRAIVPRKLFNELYCPKKLHRSAQPRNCSALATNQELLMKLFVVRHGETDYNVERKMQGYDEIPLNGQGIRQATLLGRRLMGESLDRIVSSDLRRAVMTACIVASHTGLPIHYDSGLRERDPGALTGNSYDDEPRFFSDSTYVPPSGEGVPQFRSRVKRAFQTLVSEVLLPHERVVVVTHGLVCQAFVAEFFGEEQSIGVGSRNTAMTVASFEKGLWQLETRDCALHLGATDPPASTMPGA